MEENNNQLPKKSGKKKIICISALVVVVAAIAAVLVLLFTGKLNLSKKDKAWNGIKKAKEAITKPVTDVGEKTEAKITDNDDINAFKLSTEVTADIDEISVESLSSSEKEIVDDIIELINKSKINLDLSADIKEMEGYANVSASVEDVLDDGISADIIYKDGTFAARSKEINDKYISISEKDLKDIDGMDEFSEILDRFKDVDLSAVMLSEDEIKYFTDKYGDIIEKQIKSMDMKSSKDTVKVNGKEKKCTKTVVTIGDSEVRDLLKEIVKTYKDDDKGQKIVNRFVEEIAKVADQDADDIKEQIDDSIDEFEDSIDDIEFDGKLKITTYTTATKVYRTDLEVEVEGTDVVLQFNFKDDKNTEVVLKAAGQKIATLDIVNEKNNKEYKFSLSDVMEEQVGKVDVNVKINTDGDKTTTTISGDLDVSGVEGTFEIKDESKITKNEKKEFSTDNKLSVDIDFPDYIKAKGSLSAKTTLKVVDSVDIPDVNKSNSVSINDSDEIEKYGQDAQKNLKKITEKIQKSDAIIELVEKINKSSSSSYNNSYDYDYDDDDDDYDYDYDYDDEEDAV